MAWWVWASAALVMGLLELLVPGHILLGFALGAAATGLLLLVGGPLAAWLAGAPALALLFFAVASLVAWLVLRQILPGTKGSVRHWERDINDN